jgi:hypothetical protein
MPGRVEWDGSWPRVAELIVAAADFSDEPSDDWRRRLDHYLGDELLADRGEAAKHSWPFADDAGRPHVPVRRSACKIER